jgi:23S rRNA (pseudouridine1915-N3)-methyltransferase
VRLKESDSAGEAQAMLAALSPKDYVIALDERGLGLSTQQLHDALLAYNGQNLGRIAFLIGGADGLGAAAKDRAQTTWSLSRLTLPHRAAQMLLIEQLYRAHTMMRGEKYHRA